MYNLKYIVALILAVFVSGCVYYYTGNWDVVVDEKSQELGSTVPVLVTRVAKPEIDSSNPSDHKFDKGITLTLKEKVTGSLSKKNKNIVCRRMHPKTEFTWFETAVFSAAVAVGGYFIWIIMRPIEKRDNRVVSSAPSTRVRRISIDSESSDPAGIASTPQPDPGYEAYYEAHMERTRNLWNLWGLLQEKESERKFRRRMSDDVQEWQLEQARAVAQQRRLSVEYEDIPDVPASSHFRREARRGVRRIVRVAQPALWMPEWQIELVVYSRSGGDPCLEIEHERTPILGIMRRVCDHFTRTAALYTESSTLETQRDELHAEKAGLQAKKDELSYTWFIWPSERRAKNVVLKAESDVLESKRIALDTQRSPLDSRIRAMYIQSREIDKQDNVLGAQFAALRIERRALYTRDATLYVKKNELRTRMEKLCARKAKLEAEGIELETEIELNDKEVVSAGSPYNPFNPDSDDKIERANYIYFQSDVERAEDLHNRKSSLGYQMDEVKAGKRAVKREKIKLYSQFGVLHARFAALYTQDAALYDSQFLQRIYVRIIEGINMLRRDECQWKFPKEARREICEFVRVTDYMRGLTDAGFPVPKLVDLVDDNPSDGDSDIDKDEIREYFEQVDDDSDVSDLEEEPTPADRVRSIAPTTSHLEDLVAGTSVKDDSDDGGAIL